MIIACLLLNVSSKNCENRLLNKVFMIGCMTCPWAPTAGGTTAQSGQRNDGITAPNTQKLHTFGSLIQARAIPPPSWGSALPLTTGSL